MLKLPEQTLVYPAHDYKGDTVSTIGEEKAFNPRLNVSSAEEYAEIMNNLNLPNPKMMDVAVPENLRAGLHLEAQHRVPSIEVEDLLEYWPVLKVQLVDIREESERRRDGAIPGSIHLAYGRFASHCSDAGALSGLSKNTDLLIYCAVGERSTLAVEIAKEHGLNNISHMPGGFRAWKSAGGAVESVE